MEHPDFGYLLRHHRRAAGLTQEALAERTGLSVDAIGAIEQGRRRAPHRYTIGVLADALRLSAEDRAALADASVRPRSREDRLLPRGHVDTATLPSGSRMLQARNPLFVGRTADLERIAAALGGGSHEQGGAVAVTGMGGLGKTQLAAEFVHRYGRWFHGGVFWLSFAAPAEIPLQVASCGGAGYMALGEGFDEQGLEKQVERVLRAWRSEVPRLLVFDNCEDEALLARWRPPTGGCRVLVTSRRSSWDPMLGVQTLAVQALPRSESLELLRRFRSDLGPGDPWLDAIADVLGDLPLALHLAGSYLHRYRTAVSLEDCLVELRRSGPLQHASLLGPGLTDQTSSTRHAQSIAQTFALSYGRLDAAHGLDVVALDVLARVAWAAPGQPVPEELLQRSLGQTAVEDERLLRSDALARLAALGLLEPADGSWRLHRLLADFVRSVRPDPAARAAMDGALIACGRLATEGRIAGSLLLAVIPHLHHATRRALDRAEDAAAAALCDALGRALHAAGDLVAARRFHERALAVRERLAGPDHQDTATSLHNLGFVLYNLSDLEQGDVDPREVRRLLERALAIRERALGPDHVDTAGSLNALGILLRSQGELAAARPLLERALATRERTLPPDHPDVAASLSTLGRLLMSQGDFAGAGPLLQRALAIHRRILGPEHVHTAWSLGALGVLLQNQGDLAAARAVLKEALAIHERAQGANHYDVAACLNNLGRVLLRSGDPGGARPLLERAVGICEKVLGPAHLHTATSLHSLGMVLTELGELAAARPPLERAVAICERVVGPDHPHTAACLDSLGMLLRKEGRPDAARPLLERALAIRERALGSGHPQTARSADHLAGLLRDLGDLDAAASPGGR